MGLLEPFVENGVRNRRVQRIVSGNPSWDVGRQAHVRRIIMCTIMAVLVPKRLTHASLDLSEREGVGGEDHREIDGLGVASGFASHHRGQLPLHVPIAVAVDHQRLDVGVPGEVEHFL